MPGKKCAVCRADMDSDAIFCNEYGHAQPPEPPIVGQVIIAESSANNTKTCLRCGNRAVESVRFCPKCAYDFNQISPQIPQPTTPSNFVSNIIGQESGEFSSELISVVKRRYREGYLYARFLNGFGGVVVAIGIGIVIMGAFAALVAGGGIESLSSRSALGGPPTGAGAFIGFVIFIIGVFFGGLFVISGILTRAAGQHLKASFDGAVYSSTFLTDLDRAAVMSLPIGGQQKKTTSLVSGDQTGDYSATDDNIRENVTSAVAYGASFILGILWLPIPIYFLITKSRKYKLLRFHSWQSIVLIVLLQILSLLVTFLGAGLGSSSMMFFFPILIWLTSIGVNFLCIWKAYNNEKFIVPIIGDLAMKFVGDDDGLDV